uniref:Uncharacterized protein n=1 Tax=Rousettus aegyptiacus TaxID=9407 RepID=A0A7J8GAB9_ROUAE|nr:hypothetical protein HJG63_011519 [Rousettus aegyptiacus]
MLLQRHRNICWRSTENQRMNLKELNIIKKASQRPALQRNSFPLEKIDDKSIKGKPSIQPKRNLCARSTKKPNCRFMTVKLQDSKHGIYNTQGLLFAQLGPSEAQCLAGAPGDNTIAISFTSPVSPKDSTSPSHLKLLSTAYRSSSPGSKLSDLCKQSVESVEQSHSKVVPTEPGLLQQLMERCSA